MIKSTVKELVGVQWYKNDFYFSFWTLSLVLVSVSIVIVTLFLFCIGVNLEVIVLSMLTLSILCGVVIWSHNLFPVKVGISDSKLFFEYNIPYWNIYVDVTRIKELEISKKFGLLGITIIDSEKRISINGLSKSILKEIQQYTKELIEKR